MCLICHVILQKLYERKLHSICIHPARFGCYSHCGSGYIMHLISLPDLTRSHKQGDS